MAHNPIIEVFKIKLKPTTERAVTFRAFFKKKNNITEIDDTSLFKEYFNSFINNVDTKDFYKDKKSSKAFTAYDTKKQNDNPLNDTIRFHSELNVIEGVIEGGRYGQSRSKANLTNKKEKEEVKTTDIILDTFYFFLYTPLTSDIGVLVIQSYTEDSIKDVFINFLKPFFSTTGFFNLNIENYTPKEYIEKFKEKSTIKGISFTKNVLINHYSKELSKEIEETYSIRIEVKPKTEKASISKVKNIIEWLSPVKFNNKELGEFSKRIYLGNDSTDKAAYYDLENDLETIKPKIYLENLIEIDEDGLPDFVQLKEFCFELLKTLKKEIYIINQINEC